jgi:hypothetical protein
MNGEKKTKMKTSKIKLGAAVIKSPAKQPDYVLANVQKWQHEKAERIGQRSFNPVFTFNQASTLKMLAR